MNDPYQTRQFFNMKPETNIKLRRIIKEEIRSALKEGVLGAEDVDNRIAQGLKHMAGIEPSKNPNQNKFRVPGSDKLPEKRTDVNYRDINKPSISLPSITSSGTTKIYSKEDANNWIDEFYKLFGTPKFIVSGEKIEVENPKFKAHRELYAPAIQKDKGYEPKNEEFKRMQELAGISENEDGNTHRSKVDWYYVNEDSDYPGPKGRVIPVAAGYEDPTRFKGTELYIPAETEGYKEGNSFFDEEGNDVLFDEQYFEKI